MAPEKAEYINGKMNASELRNGFVKSKSITTKNALVAKVAEENSSFILY